MSDSTGRLSALLSRIAEGDAHAFAAFYDETSHRVYGMVLRIVRDRGLSEETTQEVFLTVWRSALLRSHPPLPAGPDDPRGV